VTLRLGVVNTHPVQYQVPWLRALARVPGVDLRVLYGMIPDPEQQGAGFGIGFQWDQPLLEGYTHEVLENVARRPGLSRFNGCNTPGVGTRVRELRLDVAIVNGWGSRMFLQTLVACRRARIPCLVRGESNGLRRRAWWVARVHRGLLRRYAACLAIGKANRDFYLQNGVPSERIFMTPYGVENERFAESAASLLPRRAGIRREWSLPADAIVALFCGKLIDKKRPLDLLRALHHARGRGGDAARLAALIVGEGPLRRECERVARELSLPVSFAGFLNQGQVTRAYVAADFLVLPSDSGETWGLVVNEAMACGRPAIVSDQVGCHADLVVPGKTGFLFPYGDTTALGDCMADLAFAPAGAAQIGEAAARLVTESYSVSRVLEGILEALRCVYPAHRAA
jgi:glycosyltransferase involved in cell wall biosynthesis